MHGSRTRFTMGIGWLIGLCFVVTLATAARRGAPVPNFSLRPPLLDRMNSKTEYMCENQELKMSCDSGAVIHLIRANYGRFSISMCNDQGNLDWSVNCISFRSFLIMGDKCSQKPNCSVIVSSRIFGDPCPGTDKYLEVQYQCVSGRPPYTTKKPHGALNPFIPMFNATSAASANVSKEANSASATTLIPLQKESEDNLKPTLHPPKNGKPNSYDTVRYVTDSVPTTSNYPSSPQLFGNDKAEIVGHTVPPLVITNEESPILKTIAENTYCPPVLARGLMWNWTRSGEVFVQKCPGGSTGLARWECGDNPVTWTPSSPDLGDCRSVWVENLVERIEKGDSVISIASELSQMTVNKSLFSKDLFHVTGLIQQTLDKAVNGMEGFLDMYRKYQVLRELLQSIVETVSKLLDKSQEDAWLDLTLLERKEVASALLDGLERSALLLADTTSREGTFRILKDNVLLSVRVMETRNINQVRFPFVEDGQTFEDSTWFRMEDSLVLPAESLLYYSKHGLTKVVFVAYNQIGQLLAPDTGYESQYSFHTPGEDQTWNTSQVVNSRVVSASVGRQRVKGLAQPVVVTLKHLQEDNVTNPKCVFWDFNIRGWSGQDCWVQDTNRSHTVCACNHLTNFAVIMDMQPTEITPTQRVLRLVTAIGCIIASICFLLAFLYLQIQRNMTGDHITIHKNLALCLMIAEILFAGGLDQTHMPVLCGIVAGLLHYFFLVAFIWVFLESFHIYVRLVEVFDGDKSKCWWYYGLAYGVPALIVSIAAIVDSTSYGTNEYCWLQADNYFIFSFVGPAVGILFGAAVFLCIATCILCHHNGLSTSIKGKEEARLVTLRMSIRWVLALLVLFALTWSTGLVYVTDEGPFVAYTFTILNALLGIFFLAFATFGNGKLSEGCEHLMSTFMSCLHKSQSTETTTGPMVASPGQLSLQQQSWNLPTEKSFNSLTFTTPGPQSTAPRTTQQAEGTRVTLTPAGILSEHPRTPVWKSSGGKAREPNGVYLANNHSKNSGFVSANGTWRSLSNNKDNSNVHVNNHHHNLSQNQVGRTSARSRSSLNSEGYGPFNDHIYESIDEDSLSPSGESPGNTLSGQGPPVENYYGDHSDMSQHSSSSYGYDQRPLLITGNGTLPTRTATPIYDLTQGNCFVPDSPDVSKYRQDRIIYNSQRLRKELARQINSPDQVESHPTFVGTQPHGGLKYDGSVPSELLSEEQLEQWETPTLPDLLRCPSDSAVVMAILDGERVVSRLRPELQANIRQPTLQQQPQTPHYKLSTYC